MKRLNGQREVSTRSCNNSKTDSKCYKTKLEGSSRAPPGEETPAGRGGAGQESLEGSQASPTSLLQGEELTVGGSAAAALFLTEPNQEAKSVDGSWKDWKP